MSLIDDVLPVVQDGWQLVADLGLAPYSVTVRSYVWSGGEVGLGTQTPSDLAIAPNPVVKEVAGREELIVGPIIPTHAKGGYTKAQLVPPDASAGEYRYLVTGPNGTHEYAFGDIDTSDPVGWMLRLVLVSRGAEPT